MSVDEVQPGGAAEAPVRRRDLAVARSLDSARLRSEGRVQRFIDAGFQLLASAESGKDFTVQDVVERSGQSLRSFYQYFSGKHELLLALFDETIRSTADEVRAQVDQLETPLARLRCFVEEYHRRCLSPANGGSPKNSPTPVMVEFCHQLLTAHQTEASRAFVPLVSLLEEVLDQAAERGVVRPGLDHRAVASTILTTIMFNAAYAATIGGGAEVADRDVVVEQMWAFVSTGILDGAG